MCKRPFIPFCLALISLAVLPLHGTSVLTYRYDNQRDGLDTTETSLTPSNLTTSTFEKSFTTSVDGAVYAQPLYVPNVTVTGGSAPGGHNVVIVCTQNDSVYAIDAASGGIVWQDSFLALNLGLTGATTITAVPSADVNSTDTASEIGICSTPVIDPTTNMLYVEAKTKQIVNGNTSLPNYVHTLFQIDITNGNATANANIVNSNIFSDTAYDGTNYTFRTDPDPTATDQDPFVVGVTGDSITVNSQNRVYFNGLRQMNRPGLMLLNGVIYAGYASHGDVYPYHGWLLGFSESTLALTAVMNLTPNGSLGGIWSSGGGVACDTSGNIYVMTGNGTFDGDNTGGTVTGLNGNNQPANGDYGDSFVKIAVDSTTSQGNQNINGWGLKVLDYFSPYNNQTLSSNDTDVGSGGVLVLPTSVGNSSHQQLIVGGGKQGVVYLIDTNAMGEYGVSDSVVQEASIGSIFDTAAFFNNNVYFGGASDNGRTFPISNATLGTPTATPDTFAWPGSSPTVSASGTSNAAVWMLDRGTNQLRAYSPDLSTEYWTSALAASNRDAVGTVEKFAVPTVADGNVFVGTTNSLVGYSVIQTTTTTTPPPPPPPPPSAPTVSTSSATSITATSVTLAGTANPKGTSTNASFNYGTTASFGSTSNTQNVGSGSSNVNFSIALTGLNPGTTYYYQAEANNGDTALGTTRSFTTLAEPTIGTSYSTDPSAAGTAVSFTVTPNGSATSVYLQYGTTTSYSDGVTATQSIGGGRSAVAVNSFISGLTPGQTYNYQVVTTSTAGTFYGPNETFTAPNIGSTLMEAKGDAAPGTSGATFSTFGNPVINSSDFIAFKGTLNVGIGGIVSATSTGIWAQNSSGTMQLIAQTGTGTAPGTTAPFTALSDPVYNDHDAVAFTGTLKTGTGLALSTQANGVWCSSTGALALVAQQGTVAPGVPGGTFASFTQIALSNVNGATNQGGVVMLATLNNNGAAGINGSTNQGIWGVDANGNLQLIVRTGDILNGKTVTALGFLPSMTTVTGQGRSFSQTGGNLVYLATFSDRSTAIITVSF
jgi:hypothetical protein